MLEGDAFVMRRSSGYRPSIFAVICASLLVLLAACQTTNGSPVQVQQSTPRQMEGHTQGSHTLSLQLSPHTLPTAVKKPTQSPSPSHATSSATRPVLAFYYTWYTSSTWCSCQMSDLPTLQYNSSDDTTIERQITEAAQAGITGFIGSWWGQGDQTDLNFAKLLVHAAAYEKATGYHFASSIYFESDSPHLSGTSGLVNALRYVLARYGNDAHFFHWDGKPVIFFWDPLGQGRTLSTWAFIRSQVDPNNQTIWSAEGVDPTLLSVFDGIHLFSAGYWGLLDGAMTSVNQSFRAKVTAYNQGHQTQKIWAAGVLPGYDDTRIPGRTGTYIVPRNNGATYSASWTAALASNPDWVTITSFNEWFEGSMIEPSIHYGTLYLDLTRQYAMQWHG